jgi:type VI secretion system protein ImpK
MADRNLGRAAGDFIARVLLVSEADEGQHFDAATLRAQLIGLIDQFNGHPLAQRLDPQELDDARFALVAWADEILLQSNWSGREQWASDLLQQGLFRTNRGGDEFYKRLSRLRPDQNAARLVFFLCFAFGFRGQLVDDEPQRMALIQQNFDMLHAAGRANDIVTAGQLSTQAYDLEVHLEPPSSGTIGRVLMRWAGGAAVLFGLLYGILFLMATRVSLPPGS